ncbi:MAG TPA: YggS family pyridoxal phosphate-dependent enzyme, partial [Anaerolineae bacterium]
AAAAQRAGRSRDDVTLVAVSKTRGAEAVVAAYAAGLRIFGENRVEEAGPKAAAVAALLARWPEKAGRSVTTDPPIWHMIGHVQSRKAGDVLPWAQMVHSVDSARLARRLGEAAGQAGQILPVLLEVNIAGEASKYGVAPTEAPAVIDAILEQPALRLEGLMTVAPIVALPEEARPPFKALARLRAALATHYAQVNWRHLSMGMTDDFEVAIEEGATIVRIGRAIFGQRNYAGGAPPGISGKEG